jgi:hypothetical protein
VSAGVRRVQREQVRGGQILDVDVVADAGAVRGGVILAEDLQLLPPAGGHLEGYRDQMRLGLMPLTQRPRAGRERRSGHVEVAQTHRAKSVRQAFVGDRHVHGQLGPSVRVGRRHRGVLADRHSGRVAVDRGGGAEHQPWHVGGADRVE